MDILRSEQLHWDIDDESLADAMIGDHTITLDDFNRLDQPYHLRSPNLILNVSPIEDAVRYENVEFGTGPNVTPLQILGAIYTYYHLPLTNEEIDRLEDLSYVKADSENSPRKLLLNDVRRDISEGRIIPRSKIMRDEVTFRRLREGQDGSFYVDLKEK